MKKLLCFILSAVMISSMAFADVYPGRDDSDSYLEERAELQKAAGQYMKELVLTPSESYEFDSEMNMGGLYTASSDSSIAEATSDDSLVITAKKAGTAYVFYCDDQNMTDFFSNNVAKVTVEFTDVRKADGKYYYEPVY